MFDHAVHVDVAPALPGNAIHGREAETGPFALGLGREKRFEETLLRRRVHSAPGVAHGNHHVWAGGDIRMMPRVFLVQHDVGGFDREPPAIRHRVPGVDRQVHQHLLDLHRVGLHVAVVTGDCPEIDCFAE